MTAAAPLIIQTRKNVLAVSGKLGIGDYRRVLGAIHTLVRRKGYQDIILDFTSCVGTYAGPVLAIAATAARLRREGVDTDLRIPRTNIRLRNLFLNAGWAHAIDPEHHDRSRFRGYRHVPVINFTSPQEQHKAITTMVDAILCSMTGLDRSDLATIEWSLNEVTDNVLVHADSDVGGFVHLQNFKERKLVEFAVVDPGVGIPTTLREGHPELRFDTDALDRAIREGVTRDSSYGQGNGLFGTFRSAEISGGYLNIHSGYARLDYHDGEIHIRSEQIPFKGTLVVAGLSCSDPKTLGEALRFEGRKYTPSDYIEQHFESERRSELSFEMAKEAASFGSRVAGEPVRTKLRNLMEMNPSSRVVIDFREIPILSSSFADEVFGKLFVNVGPMRFARGLDFINTTETVKGLIDKAILQRAKSG